MNRPAPLPVAITPTPDWWADLRERFWRLLPLKAIGISGFMWVFFVGYFHTLRNPAYPVFEMPRTSWDALVPFQPEALLVYGSLWFYVGIAPGLLLHVRELLVYGLWAAALCGCGLLVFYFWPTAVPARDVDVSAYPGFGILQGVDAAGNACPSLHVAAAVFTALWIDRLIRIVRVPGTWRWANAIWVLAIAWSTVAIRQHVVLDALAGAVLGMAFAGLSIWLSPWIGRR